MARARQIDALSRQIPVIVLATLINSAITVFVFWDRAPRLVLLLWAAALWALSLRQTVRWLRRRGAAPAEQASRSAAPRAATLALLAGALWGGMLAYLFPPGSPTHQLYLAFVGGGMAAGAATTLAVIPLAPAAFILPCLLPLAIVFAAMATAAYFGMAAMLILFTALMLVVARGRYGDFLYSMRQRFEHEALLRELAATRGDLLDLIGETSIAFAMFDAEERLTLWSANFAQLSGRPAGSLAPGRSFAEVVGPEADPRSAGAPLERRTPDGRWVRASARPTARGGQILVQVDITDLKAREAELAAAAAEKDVLLREMEHRVQNALATVQAVTLHTLQASGSMEEFKQAFMARLGALAGAHRALASGKWRSAELRELIVEALAPFAGHEGSRYCVSGEPLRVPAQLALALGMILHEFATNAGKHGAWRAAEGRVEISFALEGGEAGRALRLRWRETGGPPPATTDRQGFGVTLVQRMIAYQFHGEARMETDPEGVRWEVVVPLPEREAA